MESQTEFPERRAHKRFFCRNCAVTVNFKACPVLNISMGGFAFSYTNTADWQQDKVEKAILFGDNICLEKVAFLTVNDQLHTGQALDLLEGRKRGVRFHKLSSSQKANLETFINRLAANNSTSD